MRVKIVADQITMVCKHSHWVKRREEEKIDNNGRDGNGSHLTICAIGKSTSAF